MADALLELQGAVSQALMAAPAVQALVASRIYDRVPKDAGFPYVSFGPADASSDDADCVEGLDVSFQIDVWSRAVGFPEAKQIAGAVRAALHEAELILGEAALASLRHRQTRVMRDPDGLTSHAALTFEALVEVSIP